MPAKIILKAIINIKKKILNSKFIFFLKLKNIIKEKIANKEYLCKNEPATYSPPKGPESLLPEPSYPNISFPNIN